ncbi:MAG: AbrB/MazE/SpoVT family DNA-binding domain-containing protein [Bacilli bacterium]
MASTIVGEKGQIVIPKVIRDMFEINPGDRVIVLADKKRGIAIVKEDGFLNMAVKAMDNNE